MEEALDGKLQPAPDESWRPYEQQAVVGRYLEVLLPDVSQRQLSAEPVPAL